VRIRPVAKLAGGLVIIALATLLVYRGILFPPDGRAAYPWSSDTLGHVLKAEFLQREVASGRLYPNILPSWYMGIQMLRYYPPLPYYLLVGLTYAMGDSVAAANWFIALCALAGALAWLPYHRWVGWLPAMAGGLLYLFLPDNVRVALAEGNLPRVLATALLPLAIYFLLRSLEATGTRWHRLGLALCFALIVLSHVMMAAIYAACSALLSVLCWAGRVTTMRRVILAIVSAALGIMLSGWWLLPSLTGGITELDSSAMTEALAVFPLTTYMNPTLRMSDPEIVYPGAALLLAAVALLFFRRGRDGWVVSLTLTGLFGVLITTPGFNQLFNALPLHHLFWSLRFLGIASFTLLLALVWRMQAWDRKSVVATVLVLGLLVADGALSLPLIHLRPVRQDVIAVAESLPALTGWREATLDYSRLGSAASYFFTAVGGREQVYGWAYQGARTARNVAAINEALRWGYSSYVLNRLTLLGADDVVLLRTAPIDPSLPPALAAAGFVPTYDGRETTLYHRDGAPRAYRVNWRALGIGRGAQNLAYLFPQLIVGTRSRVDDYTFDELVAYDTLFLSGFQWANRERAEELVQQVAQAGVQIVVDLTGVPNDPLAREPYFLDVWGELIALGPSPIQVEGDGQSYQLQPFSAQFPRWQTHTPQGLDVETLYHDYLGAKSTVLGYNVYGRGRVWFIGLNLPYHAALTGDPVVVDLLADLLQLPAGQPNDYQAVPLTDYTPSQSGYSFSYTLDTYDTLLVPVAHHEGTKVQVDGRVVPVDSFENLVAFDAPAGQHEVTIQVRPTPIYTWGWVASGLALLSIVGSTFLHRAGGKLLKTLSRNKAWKAPIKADVDQPA
jgi:uncharacterized membrane protein